MDRVANNPNDTWIGHVPQIGFSYTGVPRFHIPIIPFIGLEVSGWLLALRKQLIVWSGPNDKHGCHTY